MRGQNKKAFIGREYKPVWDPKKKEIVRLNLSTQDPLFLDFTRKQHTFIVARSGGGKSYLAGVYAEELSRRVENYGVVMLDPMGIFATMNHANPEGDEFAAWNAETRDNLAGSPMACQVWVPEGDAKHFQGLGERFRTFALEAPEFSAGTLCYAFDMKILDPQVNLYRKAQEHLLKTRGGTYTLEELIELVRLSGAEDHFQPQTVEALVTKLEALHELGIISREGIPINEAVREGRVSVFDLSMSGSYTAKIIVNFFAEKLLWVRKRVTRLVTRARVTETQVEKPAWYIPPVQLVIDEAHNYLPRNHVLQKCIKEGRNCGVMITAISQSPDLTRDLYANITHLFVGAQVFDGDIAAVKAMIPVERSPKEFRKQIKSLTTGCFWYYNIDKKIEKRVRVRPRYTLHPASTELTDERKFFRGTRGCREVKREEERTGQERKRGLILQGDGTIIDPNPGLVSRPAGIELQVTK